MARLFYVRQDVACENDKCREKGVVREMDKVASLVGKIFRKGNDGEPDPVECTECSQQLRMAITSATMRGAKKTSRGGGQSNGNVQTHLDLPGLGRLTGAVDAGAAQLMEDGVLEPVGARVTVKNGKLVSGGILVQDTSQGDA